MNSAESSFPTQSSIPLAYYQQGYLPKTRNDLELLALAQQQPDLANQLNALAFAQNPHALLNLNGLQQSESPERLLMSLQSRKLQNDPMAGLMAMAQQSPNDPYAGRYQTAQMANPMGKRADDWASQVSKLSMDRGNNQLNSLMQLLEGNKEYSSQVLGQPSLNELLLLQQQINNKNVRNPTNPQGYPYYMNFQNPNSLNGLLPNQNLYASQNQLYFPQGPEIIDLESLAKRQLESQQLAFQKNTPENSLSALMTPEYEHLLKSMKQPAKNNMNIEELKFYNNAKNMNLEELKFYSNESLTSPSPQHAHLHQKQSKAQQQHQQHQHHHHQQQQQQQQAALNHQKQQQQLQQQQKQHQQQQHQQQQQQLQQLLNQQKQQQTLQTLQTPPPKEHKSQAHTPIQSHLATPVQQHHQNVAQPQTSTPIQIQHHHVNQPQPQSQPQTQQQLSKPKPAPIEITVIDENDEPTQASPPKEVKEPQSAGMIIENSAPETKETSTASSGESQVQVPAQTKPIIEEKKIPESNAPVNIPVTEKPTLIVNPTPIPIVTPTPTQSVIVNPVPVVAVNPTPNIVTPNIITPIVQAPITPITLNPANIVNNVIVPAPVTPLTPVTIIPQPQQPAQNKCFNRLCQTDVNNEALWSKQKLNNNTFCKACLNCYNKGNFCHFCHQIYPDEETTTVSNDDKEWIECEACKTWNHIDCETLHGLKELPMLLVRDRDYKYYCPNCKGNRMPKSPKANTKNSTKNSHSKPSSPSAMTLESDTPSIKTTTLIHPRPPLDDNLIVDEGLKEPIVKKLKVLDGFRAPIIEPQFRALDPEDIDRGNFAKKKLDNMFNRSSFNKKRFSNKVYITPLESGFYIEKLLGQYGGKKIQLSESEIRGDLEVFRGLCGLKEPREREREREEENSRGFHINSAALNKERNLNTTSGRGRGAGRGRKSAFSSRQRINDDDYRDGGSDANESEGTGFYESSTRSVRNKKKFD